eukprot:362552-Chlamydomonas_euryale.AAC.1
MAIVIYSYCESLLCSLCKPAAHFYPDALTCPLALSVADVCCKNPAYRQHIVAARSLGAHGARAPTKRQTTLNEASCMGWRWKAKGAGKQHHQEKKLLSSFRLNIPQYNRVGASMSLDATRLLK